MRLASLFLALGILGLASVGCAAGDDRSAIDGDGTVSEDLSAAPGLAVLGITANGTGCSGGIDDSGAFDSFEASVEEGQAFSIKDCTVALDLRIPAHVTVALKSVALTGSADLDTEGMSAKQTTKAYFMGNPTAGHEVAADQAGPFQDDISFDGASDELVWSPCGASRALNVQSRIVLENNKAKSGTGTARIDAASHWKLVWKHC